MKFTFFIVLSILFVYGSMQTDNEVSTCQDKKDPSVYLGVAEDMILKAKNMLTRIPNTRNTSKPLDCEDLKELGHDTSGIHTIWPKNRVLEDKPLQVYCDMKTDGGGWTVIQRRGNYSMPANYFFREWLSYKNGFGNLDEEFWLGNDNIFSLTNQKLYSVRFDLEAADGEKGFAVYDKFWIDDENNNYTLHIKEYNSGNAGDSMNYHDGQRFSTKDRDNDRDKRHCAQLRYGGWWYNACYYVNLNGRYMKGPSENLNLVVWNDFRHYNESLVAAEIKIKSYSARKLLTNSEFL